MVKIGKHRSKLVKLEDNGWKWVKTGQKIEKTLETGCSNWPFQRGWKTILKIFMCNGMSTTHNIPHALQIIDWIGLGARSGKICPVKMVFKKKCTPTTLMHVRIDDKNYLYETNASIPHHCLGQK